MNTNSLTIQELLDLLNEYNILEISYSKGTLIMYCRNNSNNSLDSPTSDCLWLSDINDPINQLKLSNIHDIEPCHQLDHVDIPAFAMNIQAHIKFKARRNDSLYSGEEFIINLMKFDYLTVNKFNKLKTTKQK